MTACFRFAHNVIGYYQETGTQLLREFRPHSTHVLLHRPCGPRWFGSSPACSRRCCLWLTTKQVSKCVLYYCMPGLPHPAPSAYYKILSSGGCNIRETMGGQQPLQACLGGGRQGRASSQPAGPAKSQQRACDGESRRCPLIMCYQLIKMADSVATCRHVVRPSSTVTLADVQVLQAICRYFGEAIDDTDEETLKRYCNAMCDVRSALSSLSPLLFLTLAAGMQDSR
jgi:hypothetical protein